MAAPWGVELDENVLCVVKDYVLVVVGDDDDNGAFLLLRDRLALNAGLDLAGDKVINESPNILVGDLLGLIKGELLVLGNVLDCKGRPFVDLEV